MREKESEEVNSRLSNIVLSFDSFDPYWDEIILQKKILQQQIPKVYIHVSQ